MSQECPVTGQPLPAGYYLHPSTCADFEHAFTRISIVFTALKEYQLGLTAPWESEVKTQPTNHITLREVETIDKLVKRVQSAFQTISRQYRNNPNNNEHLTLETKYPGLCQES